MNRHIKSLYSWARNYAEGGPKKDKFYNTQLTPEQEQQYQQWVQTLPINLRSDYDYDLRGAWLNGDLPDQNYHMTDKWKKPWHPTFSNESIYSTPQMTGGHWDGDTFIPSTTNNFINDFHYGQWGANSFAKGGYKAYSKSADKLNEEYGIDMSMSKKAFRQNRKNAWAGLEQSQQVAEQLASQTPYQMTPSERVENYVEGNNIPVDAGNYVYNYRQAKQRDAYKDYVSYMSQLANPTTASFANRVAERPDYRGIANLETALALSPLAFSAAGNAGKLYKVLTHPVTDMALTAHGAITAPSNIKKGIENIRSGNTGEGIVDLGLTALDIAGAGQLLGRASFKIAKNIKANTAFNRSELPQQLIDDVKNAVNNDAQRWALRAYQQGELIPSVEYVNRIHPQVEYKTGFKNWFKYSDTPILDLLGAAAFNRNGYMIVMNPLAAMAHPQAYKGIIAHEARHSFQYPFMPQVSIPTKKYYGPNPNFELYGLIDAFEKPASKGKWSGSPEELLAEMANWKYQRNVLNVPYYQLDKQLQKKFIKDASFRFGFNELRTSMILDGLSKYGYFDAGGPIHTKPENRGKFTAAANRAGKSVQAYASQILANKDHYSTTLVKRANFAKNAKKFHH